MHLQTREYQSLPAAGRKLLDDTFQLVAAELVCNEYKAGLDLAVERGWLILHESGTFVRFTQTGADLFA